jgi:hypothetical protein
LPGALVVSRDLFAGGEGDGGITLIVGWPWL